MNDNNRDHLYVEVDQPELREKIFHPLYNVKKNYYRFFSKRFAILGDFKVGKTELGTYIIKKIEKSYSSKNIISIKINTEEARTKTAENIKGWIYRQWLIKLRQIEKSEFKNVVIKVLQDFEEERGYKCEDIEEENFIEIIYIITKIYKTYQKKNRNARYIVEFDQANVIYRDEEEFLPFYQFWRNFQGYWEEEKYFANLNIFIFVIGHKNWENYASLKESSGEGIFDIIVLFKHWTNSDVYKMLEKRIKYALKPNYEEKIEFFLPKGIVNFLRNKLGKVNVYEYLKSYLGADGYLRKFFKNFKKNKNEYRNLLDFCKRIHRKTDWDNTYFKDIERLFVDNLESDYMQVFKYLSDHQDEPWFDELFKLIDKLYDEGKVLFESSFLKKLKYLKKDFLSQKFSYDIKDGLNPELMPPIFIDYERNLRLDRTFKERLSGTPLDKRGPSYRLKRYIKSRRIRHKNFLESTHGKEMKSILIENNEISKEIMKIFDEWVKKQYYGVINKKLEFNDKIRTDFLSIQNRTFTIFQLYKGNSTKWGLFDSKVRELGIFIIKDLLPENSKIKDYINLKGFKDDIKDPSISNIEITRVLNSILSDLLEKIKIFDSVLKEKRKNKKSGRRNEKNITKKIPDIISEGETRRIEFKSTLRWCLNSEKIQPYCEKEVIKTISAFMNSYGGILLIGVGDNGEILGLENDYKTFSKRKDKDRFSQHLSHLIDDKIGIENSTYWKEEFISLEKKEICIVKVKQSSNPVFTKVNKVDDEFYVRSGTTTKSLNYSQTHEYINRNFK